MTDLIYWFMFWKKAKSVPQAVFQGMIGGLVFGLVALSPLWIALLEVSHGR